MPVRVSVDCPHPYLSYARKTFIFHRMYCTLLLFQRGGNRIQSVLPLTAAMIYNATHTGDNEFELDGVPLGQVGRCGVRCGRGCVVCGEVGR